MMELKLKRIAKRDTYTIGKLFIDGEVWKPIERFIGYEVSNLGRVRSVDRIVTRSDGKTIKIKGRILRDNVGTNGYSYVICSINGKQHTIYIHKEVASAFIGEPNGLDVDHINSNKIDNRLENLRYLTHFENSSRSNKGRHKDNSMEKNPRTKIVVGYLEGVEIERFDCAKKVSFKYGINYSTLKKHLQKEGIKINGILYQYGIGT